MTSTNRTPQASRPELDFSAPNFIPPVEISRPDESDADLDHWANQRMAIYASLDAAMTRHIVEAISALSELKRQTEEEAHRTSHEIIRQRDAVKQEAEELRLEKIRLEDNIKESRRIYEDELDRRVAMEQSSAAWKEQARLERDELQLEIKRLKVQLEEAREELQSFYRNRSEGIDAEGGVAAWFEKQAQGSASKPVEETALPLRPVELPPQMDTALPAKVEPEPPAVEPFSSVENLPAFMLPEMPPQPQTRSFDFQAFGDAPTPRLPGGSPVAKLEQPLELDVSAFEPPKISPAMPEPVSASEARQLPSAPQSGFEEQKPAAPGSLNGLVENPLEKEEDRSSRSRAEQRVSQILGKRRPQLPQITTAADGGEVSEPKMVADEAASLSDPAPTTRSKPGKKRAANVSEDKNALRDLGNQLGLDTMTPPPEDNFRFAPGFTPPPLSSPLLRLMAEMRENAQAVALQEAAPASPELLQPEASDFGMSDEFGPMTLEELLTAGEQELALINENPTPPEDPSPMIGNIGPDNAGRFDTGSITHPGLIRTDKVSEVAPDPSDLATRPDPTPLPRKSNRSMYPGMPLRPPPLPAQSAEDVTESVVTKITVSNLQGRYSPLVMEKVVRGLEGVIHVIVTDFSKGVLVMDVRHRASLSVADKLISMPELRMKLVGQDSESLEFTQEIS